ncbi:hypothetical protein [Actinocorallia sp. B10E7]|uniref:hypothetical protein n=1 Tax=Actinocorallia sp. B10E7 TaxID=3153558 RepID=UPI00325F96D6
MTTSLQDYLEEIMRTLPGRGSERFVEGRGAEVARVGAGVSAARSGRLAWARTVLARVGYRVVRVTDTGTRRDYLVIREPAPCRRCWGTYVLPAGGRSRATVVEVPHPRSDEHTEAFGTEAFQALNASALLIAGTHRAANRSAASDVAHNGGSAFTAVHRRLTARGTLVLQYHGFGRAGRARYPQVVISDGVDRKGTGARPPAHLRRLERNLRARGISAGVFDGTRWRDLGATRNVQGAHTRAQGGRFVHMEHAPEIRRSEAERTRAIRAVRMTFP